VVCACVCARERERRGVYSFGARETEGLVRRDLQAKTNTAAGESYCDVLFVMQKLREGANQETGACVREVEDCGWSVQSPRVPCDWSLTGC
jgi:hypothetical protein